MNQQIIDPATGRLRRVVYVDRQGRPVAPPPPALLPPAADGRQTIVYPQTAAPPAFQLGGQQAPFVPPMHEAPTHYNLAVSWSYDQRAQRRARAQQGDSRGTLLTLLLNAVTTMLALYALWVVGGWAWEMVSRPAVQGWGDTFLGGREMGMSTNPLDRADEVAVVETAQPTAAPAAASPAQPLVMGDVVVPADLGDLTMAGPPSLSPQTIDQYLGEMGSPAEGTGQYWYTQGLAHGIDPVFAVAFFLHESGLGTNPAWAGWKPDGKTTHNVGNIICAGYATCYGRFRDYASWEEGIADWYRLLKVEYLEGRGHRTVADVIPVYAPAFENDVQGYIDSVQRTVRELRERQAATGGAAPTGGEAGLSAEGAHLRVSQVTATREGEQVVVDAVLTNIGTTDHEVNLRAVTLYDNERAQYVGSSATAMLKPGESVPIDLTVPVPSGVYLTRMVIEEAPGRTFELALGNG